jgi:hypothetical protein
MSYCRLSVAVACLNVVATSQAIFALTEAHAPGRGALVTILFLIGGSWSTRLEDGRQVGHFQIFAFHLCLCKTTSFSIPMTLFALFFLQDTGNMPCVSVCLSGVLTMLNPSALVSVAFFVCTLSYRRSYGWLIAFAVCLIPKLIGANLSFCPAWKDYETIEHPFSTFVCYFWDFGFPFFTLFLFWINRKDYVFRRRIVSSCTGFAFACLFREGSDVVSSDAAVSSVFVPILLINFVRVSDEVRGLSEVGWFKGLANFITFLMIGTILITGGREIWRISHLKIHGFGPSSLDISRVITQRVPHFATIFTDSKGMNPVSTLTGRQILLGRVDDLARRGYNWTRQHFLFNDIMTAPDPTKRLLDKGIMYVCEFRPRPVLLKTPWIEEKFTIMHENNNWMLLRLNNPGLG